jgi:hypothetical protein
MLLIQSDGDNEQWAKHHILCELFLNFSSALSFCCFFALWKKCLELTIVVVLVLVFYLIVRWHLSIERADEDRACRCLDGSEGRQTTAI